MSDLAARFDVVVLGGGPAGQKAAVCGAKAGARVLLVDRHPRIGGECVQRGTIPSKTLRESAVYLAGLRQRSSELLRSDVGPGTIVRTLMQRLDSVLAAHETLMTGQIERNGIELLQGRACLLGPHEVLVTRPDGSQLTVSGETIVIATGSRPRQPEEIPIDHEHVLDSDSILRLAYLPRSLCVLGGGVIACEFATIFQALGVAVAQVDRGERLLPSLDAELSTAFAASFAGSGGRFVPRTRAAKVEFDGLSEVVTTLESGEVLRTEKVLVALGRKACLAGFGLERVGLAVNDRGFLDVDEHCRTRVPSIYAAGDVIGPPALAAASMEQGRRAVRHALGLEVGKALSAIPTGIYAIPEIACVGLTEAEAVARHGGARVGRARFAELARGQINGATDGLLKLVADPSGEKLLGAHILGEGATELIHLAQVALLGGLPVDAFVENIFNFPTLAEGYRVAALDIAGQLAAIRRAA